MAKLAKIVTRVFEIMFFFFFFFRCDILYPLNISLHSLPSGLFIIPRQRRRDIVLAYVRPALLCPEPCLGSA